MYQVCKYRSGGFGDGPQGPKCDATAHWISCQPVIGTPTCDAHRCRCAKPIDSPPSPPPVTIEELADATTRLLGICALSTLPPGARAYLAEVAALLARVPGAK